MNIETLFHNCLKLTMSKRHDYTSADDAHENFKRMAEVQSWFKSNIDKPYVCLIAVKLARLGSLLDAKEPNNESIEDTFMDLINYCGLWAERRTSMQDILPVKLYDNNSNNTQMSKCYDPSCILFNGHPSLHRNLGGGTWR